MPKFLKYFEAVLTNNEKHTKKEDGWLVGESLTYADLMLYQVIDGVRITSLVSWKIFVFNLISQVKHAFPKRMEKVVPDYPKVFALYERVQNRPKIAAYLKSERRMKYGNGVYRYYAELDAED